MLVQLFNCALTQQHSKWMGLVVELDWTHLVVLRASRWVCDDGDGVVRPSGILTTKLNCHRVWS